MPKSFKPVHALKGDRDKNQSFEEALQAANPDTPIHGMDGYRFDHEGHAQECVLPPLHRFVVVCGGQANKVLSDCEPGTYVFVAPPPPDGGGWPQMLLVVDFDHLQAILNMNGDQTAELIRMLCDDREVN